MQNQQANEQANEQAKEEKPLFGGYISQELPKSYGNFVIVAMQNNTEIHPDFWPLVKEYAKDLHANIIACPILYNKNAWAQPDDVGDSIWFDKEAKTYMVENRIILNDDILLISNAHVLPTAKNPLSGFQTAGENGQTIIIPASKIALECLPALKGEKPRTMLSTGTVTQKNYVQRKAGMVAELDHNFGFVVIEAGKMPRSIEYKNGGFYDFDGNIIRNYGKMEEGAVVLTFGDIHAEKCDNDRISALSDIIRNLQPNFVNFHDLLDFTSRNHHNRENHFFRYSEDLKGNNVKSDIAKAKKALLAITEYLPIGAACNIVQSNHDLALDRWLNEADYREDMLNAPFYLKLASAKIKAIKAGVEFNAFAYAFGKCTKNVRFNGTDESLKINGVEFGNHGDKGANGARGSIQGFRKLGAAMVIGHSHTPGIAGNVYQVGVGGNMQMGYNQGPSSWRHAHCVTFANGQSQIIFE